MDNGEIVLWTPCKNTIVHNTIIMKALLLIKNTMTKDGLVDIWKL